MITPPKGAGTPFGENGDTPAKNGKEKPPTDSREGKLGYSATNNYKREQAFFFCSAYRSNSDVCSAHYIRESVVGQLVLEGLQRLLWYI